MAIEDNKRIVRRIIEAGWNRVDEDVIADLYDPGVANEGGTSGLSELMKGLASTRAAFPDCFWAIDDLIGEGNTVVACWSARGTHTGALGDIAPTGRVVEVEGVTIFQLAAGRVTAWRRFADDLGMLQQLGVMS